MCLGEGVEKMIKQYIKISKPGLGSYTQPLEHIGVIYEEVSEMQYGEVGEKIILELVEMEEEDHKRLLKFTGW